ncbi:MAG TPA: hypothetical protein RMH99_06665, partial [Sandaracinaceae bacterium LLY-WYZ-13_1]|nr:hypothetical protein [Sandaracinaceae bacterium LLY-WYZ-13_1]
GGPGALRSIALAAAVVLGLAAIAGVAWLLGVGSDDGGADGVGPVAAGDGADEGAPAGGRGAERAGASEDGERDADGDADADAAGGGADEGHAEGEAADDAAGTPAEPLGPAEGERLEGDEADFDLAALGIEEAPPPSSRRRRARTVRELIRQANILRNRDQLDEAEELYFRVLSLDPRSPRATAGMIRIYMEREDAASAIRFAQRLVRLRPAFASNWVLLGDTFELGGNPDAALRAWTHAVELEPRWRPARERIRRIGRRAPPD